MKKKRIEYCEVISRPNTSLDKSTLNTCQIPDYYTKEQTGYWSFFTPLYDRRKQGIGRQNVLQTLHISENEEVFKIQLNREDAIWVRENFPPDLRIPSGIASKCKNKINTDEHSLSDEIKTWLLDEIKQQTNILTKKIENKLLDDGYIPIGQYNDNFCYVETTKKNGARFDIFDGSTSLNKHQQYHNYIRKAGYSEWKRQIETAYIQYGSSGHEISFELNANGSTRFFPTALDAVNFLSAQGWHLEKTFTSAPATSHSAMTEHWIMAREIEIDE